MTEKDAVCMRTVQKTADLLMDPTHSPLDLVIIIPVWRNGEAFKAGPVLHGSPDALPFVVEVLRELADRIEQGDFRFASGGTSPGGSA